ncbi:MAG: aminopeptidase, partial [Anaerolineales bacterium]
MKDPRLAKLADLLVNYCNEVKPGDWCIIQGEMVVAPLGREIYRAVLEAGGHPTAKLFDPEMRFIELELASDEQLDFASPIYELVMDEADALFSIFGSVNTRMLSNMDPQRVARYQKANQKAIETY